MRQNQIQRPDLMQNAVKSFDNLGNQIGIAAVAALEKKKQEEAQARALPGEFYRDIVNVQKGNESEFISEENGHAYSRSDEKFPK